MTGRRFLGTQQCAKPAFDESGETSECDSTSAVVRGIAAVAGEAGIGGGLQRLLQRVFGAEGS